MAGKLGAGVKSNRRYTDAQKSAYIKQFKVFRARFGLTQSDIASIFGVTDASICYFETKKFSDAIWSGWKNNFDDLQRTVKDLLNDASEEDEQKKRVVELIKRKRFLRDEILKLKAENGEAEIVCEKKQCQNMDLKLKCKSKETDETVVHVKSEVLSQESSQKVRENAYNWFKIQLDDRDKQLHFVYIVFDPKTGKIIYVGESCDVVRRLPYHRGASFSPIQKILKENDAVDARIVFAGSYFECKAVEGLLIVLQKELDMKLLNRKTELSSTTPPKNQLCKEAMEAAISGFPVKPTEDDHDKLVAGMKFLLDRGIEFGELKLKKFKDEYNRKTDQFDGLTHSEVEQVEAMSRPKSYEVNKAKIEAFMADVIANEEPHKKKPAPLVVIEASLKKRIVQYQNIKIHCELLQKNFQNQMKELDFQNSLIPMIYSSAPQPPSTSSETLPQSSSNDVPTPESQNAYIWLRKKLDERNGILHYVYAVKNPESGIYVYIGETDDIESRIPQHNANPASSIYAFLHAHASVEFNQIYAGSFYACKTIETLLISLEEDLEFELLNKQKSTRKTTPKKKKLIAATQGIYVYPEELEFKEKSVEREKIVTALKELLKEGEEKRIVFLCKNDVDENEEEIGAVPIQPTTPKPPPPKRRRIDRDPLSSRNEARRIAEETSSDED